MKLFNQIALEIGSLCNRKCKFCPVAYNTRPKERMAEEIVFGALQELSEMKYNGRITWYIYNEPCMDMEWLKTVAMTARHLVPRATQMIATNGDYLRNGAQDLMDLYDSGIQQILLNCYTKGLYERRLPWIEEVAKNGVEVNGPIYSKLPRNKRTIQMLDKSNPETFGTGVFALQNRAGNIPEFTAATCEAAPRMCVRPFRFLNINWLGEGILCCNDYHGDVLGGKFPQQSLMQIWNSPTFNTYRQHLLNKNREMPLCEQCDCHSGAYPGNVSAPDGEFATEEEIRAAYQQRVELRTKR